MTETTHMRREILEIPEAAARLLDASDGALAAAGRQLRELSPRYPDHGGARLVRPCGVVPEICGRADGRRSGRLARAVDRLDLRRQAQARRLGLPDHLAVGQEPGHRRHGASRAGRRRADRRHHQHRRLAAGRGVRPRDRHPGRRGKKRRGDQELRQFGASPGCLLLAHWTDDTRTACGAAAPAGAFPQGDRLRLDGDCRAR